MIDIKGLLDEASKRGVSDVHICCGASPKYRIHGRLVDSGLKKISQSDCLAVLLDLIDQEQRDAFEQNGVIDVSVSVGEGRFRVNAYKQRGRITLAIRIVDTSLPDPKDLYIPGQVLSFCEKDKGLVIVSGPSGSGKSTMLAAMLDRINSERSCNIITLEDPIEYLHEHKLSIVNQREIGIDAISYEEALISVLREDPDVIYVSRINSAQNFLNVLRAVESGKLVFCASLYTGVRDVVSGIIDMFDDGQKASVLGRFSSALEGIVARQLLPTADGGRRPAYEVLIADNEVREALRSGKLSLINNIMHTGHDRGMFTMDESVLGLFVNKVIDAETAVRYSVNTDAMKRIVFKDQQ